MSVLTLYNNLNSFLILGALLFGIGIYGIVTRKRPVDETDMETV